MSSFRKPVTVLTESNGGYVDGVWVAGSRSSSTIQASVQPVDREGAKYLQSWAQGRHFSDMVKIYTDSILNIAQEDSGKQSDIVMANGYGYELKEIHFYQSGVINHFKYVGVKIFAITSASQWTNGTIKRPT